MAFREGQEVRVRALLERKSWERHSTGSAGLPAVGDIGVVVDVDGSTGRMTYTVECVDAHGLERWLTAFEEEELEAIPSE
jgi:hypothetical protein